MNLNVDRWDYLNNVKLSFGKFKGYPLAQVPVKYLLWMASTPDLSDPVLQMDVVEYVKHPNFKKEQKYREQQEATDIKPIPRGWRR